MNFFESLQHNINTQIFEFLKNISEKYDIEYDDIKQDWESYVSKSPKEPVKKTKKEEVPVKVVKKTKNDEEEPVKVVKKTKKDEEEEPVKKSPKKEIECGTCIYTYVKPPKTGEVCGTKIKGDGKYCSKHKMYEKKDKKEFPKSEEKIEKNSPKKPELDKTLSIRINNKIGKFVHPLTGMVFFSKDEKVVYGKLVKDTVHELSDSDIETCKKYGFKIDKSKFTKASAKSPPPKQKIENKESDNDEKSEQIEDDLEDD